MKQALSFIKSLTVFFKVQTVSPSLDSLLIKEVLLKLTFFFTNTATFRERENATKLHFVFFYSLPKTNENCNLIIIFQSVFAISSHYLPFLYWFILHIKGKFHYLSTTYYAWNYAGIITSSLDANGYVHHDQLWSIAHDDGDLQEILQHENQSCPSSRCWKASC